MIHEGDRDVTNTANRVVCRLARDAGGQPVGAEEALAWVQEDPAGDAPACEGGVHWTELASVLAAADRKLGGYRLAVADRPVLEGCRLRLELTDPSAGDDAALARLIDQDGSQARSLQTTREVLLGIRRQLDPDGLLNPQAWPPPWPGEPT
jgi:hypothetical protein